VKGRVGTPATRRPRPAGVDVRPEAVRQARIEAGLSLADVAGQEVTRAAIHLIETGKSRPSMDTLALVAKRTGKPVSYFLATGSDGAPPRGAGHRRQRSATRPPDRIEHLERLVLSGDNAALKEAAGTVLATAEDAREKAFAHYYLGRAQILASDPEAARINLVAARDYFSQSDPWMVVECMDWEAGALYTLERPEALSLAQESLTMCRQLKPVPISMEVRILGHLGAIHVSRHEWKEAISSYEKAVQKAGPVVDLERLARMYQDLSLAYQETGAMGNAVSYAQKALALYEMQENREAQAWVENNLGLVLLKLDQIEQGERHLQNALTIFNELGLQRRKSNLLLSLAELEMTRGAYGKAEAYATQALASAEASEELMTAGLAHQTLGQLTAIQRDDEVTDQQFAAALNLLGQSNAPARILECHLKYADILEKRGDWQSAVFQLRQAVKVAHPHVAESSKSIRSA
jgi:tetratricopeptide (TPR) repeat protein/DNA-binding XRE family transcriptional regulator